MLFTLKGVRYGGNLIKNPHGNGDGRRGWGVWYRPPVPSTPGLMNGIQIESLRIEPQCCEWIFYGLLYLVFQALS
jgi:hypothetical protein